MAYIRSVPIEISKQAVEHLRAYQKKHGLSMLQLAVKAGVTGTTCTHWLRGDSFPRLSAVKGLIDAGISNIDLSDALQKKAVQAKLREADRKNNPPRPYKRRVQLPDLVLNQLKLLIDDYVEGLSEPRTFQEFKDSRDAFIYKLYYTCSQAE